MHVWIYHNDERIPALCIFPEVAEQLGLCSGDYVDEATFQRAMRLTWEVGMAICDLNIAINEQNKAAEETPA